MPKVVSREEAVDNIKDFLYLCGVEANVVVNGNMTEFWHGGQKFVAIEETKKSLWVRTYKVCPKQVAAMIDDKADAKEWILTNRLPSERGEQGKIRYFETPSLFCLDLVFSDGRPFPLGRLPMGHPEIPRIKAIIDRISHDRSIVAEIQAIKNATGLDPMNMALKPGEG